MKKHCKRRTGKVWGGGGGGGGGGGVWGGVGGGECRLSLKGRGIDIRRGNER